MPSVSNLPNLELDMSTLLPVLALCVVLALWLGVTLGRWWARRTVVRRIARHRRLGADAERVAERLLQAAGYKIAERQPAAQIRVMVDGSERVFDVRGDFLVTRRRERFLAEAKGGVVSGDVATAATRRQLLEYACAFDVAGLLLVDVAAGVVRQIEFPGLSG